MGEKIVAISHVLLEGGLTFKTYLEEGGRAGGWDLKILRGTSFMDDFLWKILDLCHKKPTLSTVVKTAIFSLVLWSGVSIILKKNEHLFLGTSEALLRLFSWMFHFLIEQSIMCIPWKVPLFSRVLVLWSTLSTTKCVNPSLIFLSIVFFESIPCH